MTASPLVAAGIDWIEGILPLLFLLFWIVSQVLNLFRGAARGRPEGPVVVRPVPRAAPDDDVRRELQRQIEEFLREGKGPGRERMPVPRRPTASPASPAEAGRRREPVPRREPPPLRPKPARAGSTPPKSAAAPIQPASVQSASMGSLGGHSTDVARHVRDAFAHQLERLPSGLERPAGVTVSAPAAGAAAADLAALLRHPATLRQLVLVREVLDRPMHRW